MNLVDEVLLLDTSLFTALKSILFHYVPLEFNELILTKKWYQSFVNYDLNFFLWSFCFWEKIKNKKCLEGNNAFNSNSISWIFITKKSFWIKWGVLSISTPYNVRAKIEKIRVVRSLFENYRITMKFQKEMKTQF